MSLAVVASLIGIVGVLCTVLGVAGGALWRLGSRVGKFEATVESSRLESIAARDAAREATERAEVAGLKWNQELVAELRSLRESVDTCERKIDLDRAEMRRVRQVVERVDEHERRITALEAAEEQRCHFEDVSGVHRLGVDGVPERITSRKRDDEENDR